MTPPPAPDPDLTHRALDLAEWIAKLAAAVGAVWAIVEKIGKPYSDRRRKQRAGEIREALAPELAQLAEIKLCNDMLHTILDRQKVLFEDVDAFITVAGTNKERLDEMNDLFDALGFTSDRRGDEERREKVSQLLRDLAARQKARRRHDELEPTESDDGP